MNRTASQQEIIDFDGGNILVSASAGSGKTTVMIDRLCKLIEERKASIENVLALTFTDASAIDMKNKLRKALAKSINEGHVELAYELNLIGNADITTIDAFCMRLVRKYFFEVGINNDFKVIEPLLNEEYKKIAIENVFNKCYEEGGEFTYYLDLFANKRSDKNLRDIVLSFYNVVSTEKDYLEAVEKYESSTFLQIYEIFNEYILKAFADYKEQFIVLEQEFKEKEYKEGLEIVCVILAIIDDYLNKKDGYNLGLIKLPSLPRDKKGEENPFAVEKDELKNLKDDFSEFIRNNKAFLSTKENDEKLFLECKKTSSFIYGLTKKFIDEFSRLKLEDNFLDFNDIEHYAIKIIDNENILKSLKEKYKYVFIDEYQDVNATQEYILTRLSSNNLFMVGDEKQSIYGFRGCVPEFFQNKFKVMKESGEKTVELKENFRSAKAVIDGVNEVFSYCMTIDKYGLNYKDDAKLVLSDIYGDNFGEARLDLFLSGKEEKESEEPRIYDIKEEALKEEVTEDDTNVLMLYNVIKEELGKEYFDAKDKTLKKITPKDIAILCRAKSGNEVNGLIKGLTNLGLNITSTAEENICEYPEIISLLNFLRLIDCFNQSVPLVDVLKSNVIGLSEDDLFEIVETFKKNSKEKAEEKNRFTFYDAFSYYIDNVESELSKKLNLFVEYINKIRLVAYYKTAGEILQEVINDYSLIAFYYADRDGEAKVKRIQRLISFCNETAYSIKSLLRASENNKITLQKGGNENAIKFITMHSSKGLEFPVVIVCRLNKQFNKQDAREKLIFDREFGLASKNFNIEERKTEEGLFRKVFKIRLDEKTEREEMRLFYVALTRATYSLHLVADIEEDTRATVYKGAKKQYDFIPKTFNTKNWTMEELKGTKVIEQRKEVILSQSNEEEIKKIKEKLSFKYINAPDVDLPLKSNVTEANKVNVETVNAVTLFSDGENSKKEQGTVAHRIMQYYDFEDGNFESQIENMIAKNILSKENLKTISLDKIKKVVNGKVLQSIKGKKLFREKGFIVKLKAKDIIDSESESEILLQGVIDLLVIGEDGAEIIDYKYSRKSAEKLKESYSKQLDLYAMAVQKILKIKVVKKSIVSLLTGEETIID